MKCLCLKAFFLIIESILHRDIYHLKNLVNVLTYYKNPLKPPCINLFLTSCLCSFQDTLVIETRPSDFHKINITVLKMFFSKQELLENY